MPDYQAALFKQILNVSQLKVGVEDKYIDLSLNEERITYGT